MKVSVYRLQYAQRKGGDVWYPIDWNISLVCVSTIDSIENKINEQLSFEAFPFHRSLEFEKIRSLKSPFSQKRSPRISVPFVDHWIPYRSIEKGSNEKQKWDDRDDIAIDHHNIVVDKNKRSIDWRNEHQYHDYNSRQWRSSILSGGSRGSWSICLSLPIDGSFLSR